MKGITFGRETGFWKKVFLLCPSHSIVNFGYQHGVLVGYLHQEPFKRCYGGRSCCIVCEVPEIAEAATSVSAYETGSHERTSIYYLLWWGLCLYLVPLLILDLNITYVP